MFRPRRPILAAICAALLLITTALWLASGILAAVWEFAPVPSREWRIAIDDGVLAVLPIGKHLRTWSRFDLSLRDTNQWTWQLRPTARWKMGRFLVAEFPLWLPLPFLALALYCSSRQRKAAAGFDVQATPEP